MTQDTGVTNRTIETPIAETNAFPNVFLKVIQPNEAGHKAGQVDINTRTHRYQSLQGQVSTRAALQQESIWGERSTKVAKSNVALHQGRALLTCWSKA